MKHLLLATLLCFAAPVAAQSVEVAEGDWSNIPEVRATGRKVMSVDAFNRAEAILGKGGVCETSSKPISLRVPFLLEFGTDKSVKRIVVRRLRCEQLESLMGGVVKQLVSWGEYEPTGENLANWYRSEISFEIR